MTTTRTRPVRRGARPQTTRLLVTMALTLVATLGISGCGDAKLGAAAVVNGEVTTVDELQQDTRDYLEVVPGADAGAAQVAILQQTVITEVLEEVARKNDVHVPPGRIAAERDELFQSFNGRRGLVRTLANSQEQPTVLPPDDVEDWVKDRLLFNAIAEKIGGGPLNTATPESQQVLEEVQKQLTKASGSLDIEINPRYGTWDPQSGITPLVSGGLSRTAAELKKSGA
jgi:hypothetical protein